MSVNLEVHYPQRLPYDAAQYVITSLTSGAIVENRKLLAEAVWNIQGYAQLQLIGEEQHLIGDTPDFTTDDFVAALRAIPPTEATFDGLVGAPKIDWRKVLDFIKNVLPLVLPLL